VKTLIYSPTWIGADKTLAIRDETRAAISLLGATKTIIGTVNPYPGYDYRNVTAQYQAAWKATLKGGFDYLLTVEHDIVPPADALTRLLAMNKLVAFGVYVFRVGPPYVVNAYRWLDDCLAPDMSLTLFPKQLEQARARGIVRCSGVGWGCTLIRRDVIEKIAPRGDRDCDLNFARDCIKANVEMYANLNVTCGHWHDRLLMPFEGEGLIAVHCLKDFVGRSRRGSSRFEAGKNYKIMERNFDDYRRAGYVEALS